MGHNFPLLVPSDSYTDQAFPAFPSNNTQSMENQGPTCSWDGLYATSQPPAHHVWPLETIATFPRTMCTICGGSVNVVRKMSPYIHDEARC